MRGMSSHGVPLPAREYDVYEHKGEKKFTMHMPRRGVPWEGGWIEYQGGMYDSECRCGVVKHAVFHPADGGRPMAVALKVLDRAQDRAQLDSWEHEVDVMQRLQPRGLQQRRVCRQFGLWDFRAVDGEPNVYIATEWAAGGTLQAWATRHVRELKAANQFGMWFKDVLPRLAQQLLQGLAHMQACGQHGIAHLDLDPVNIVMSSNDLLTAELRFIDFGSARCADAAGQVGDDGIKWKFHYCAPEIHDFYNHKLDRFAGADADMFSAGTILWWLIALPPACLFQDLHSKRVVDIEKHWLKNLRLHAEGLHTAAAMEEARQQLVAAERSLAEAVHHATVAHREVSRLHGELVNAASFLQRAPYGRPQAQAQEHQMAVMAEYNAAVAAAAVADDHARTCSMQAQELRAGNRVVEPFRHGECLCCRWGFNIPRQWCSLVVHVLLRDRTNAAHALRILHRDVLLTPAPGASAAADQAAAVVQAAAVDSAAAAAVGAAVGSVEAAVPSAGAVPREVAEAALQDDPSPSTSAASAKATRHAAAIAAAAVGAGAGAAASGVPLPVPLERGMSLTSSYGGSLGGPSLGLSVLSSDGVPQLHDLPAGAGLGVADAMLRSSAGYSNGSRYEPGDAVPTKGGSKLLRQASGGSGAARMLRRPRVTVRRDEAGRPIAKTFTGTQVRAPGVKRDGNPGGVGDAAQRPRARTMSGASAAGRSRGCSDADFDGYSAGDLSVGAASVSSTAASVQSSASVRSAWSTCAATTVPPMAAGHAPTPAHVQRLRSDASMVADRA